jgi:hypothetical protein
MQLSLAAGSTAPMHAVKAPFTQLRFPKRQLPSGDPMGQGMGVPSGRSEQLTALSRTGSQVQLLPPATSSSTCVSQSLS